MDDLRELLELTSEPRGRLFRDVARAARVPSRDVRRASQVLRRAATGEPTDPRQVIEALAAATDPGLVAEPAGRYFGFVIGGAVPASLAADWLTSAWDQNAGLYVGGPAAAVVEEVAGAWLLELLGLPARRVIRLRDRRADGELHRLAAARHHVLANAGWDVERDGLERRAADPRDRRREAARDDRPLTAHARPRRSYRHRSGRRSGAAARRAPRDRRRSRRSCARRPAR